MRRLHAVLGIVRDIVKGLMMLTTST